MFISPVVSEILGGWYQPPSHPNMLVSCQKEQMLLTVNQMYKVMPCHQHLDTDQVISLSEKYKQKWHFQTSGQILRHLVCIVLIIISELDIMKKSYYT